MSSAAQADPFSRARPTLRALAATMGFAPRDPRSASVMQGAIAAGAVSGPYCDAAGQTYWVDPKTGELLALQCIYTGRWYASVEDVPDAEYDEAPSARRLPLNTRRECARETSEQSRHVAEYLHAGRRHAPAQVTCRKASPRPRGAGRPRGQATRSSAKSGDSGPDGPGEPEPPRRRHLHLVPAAPKRNAHVGYQHELGNGITEWLAALSGSPSPAWREREEASRAAFAAYLQGAGT